ncbi:MAG TPA: hypothetical protein VGF99_10880, partial [Myxococcota bacterium]
MTRQLPALTVALSAVAASVVVACSATAGLTCVDDTNCPGGQACGADGLCSELVAEGEGEGEG